MIFLVALLVGLFLSLFLAWWLSEGSDDLPLIFGAFAFTYLIIAFALYDITTESRTEKWDRLFSEGDCSVTNSQEVTGRITGKAQGLTSYTIYEFTCPELDPVWADSYGNPVERPVYQSNS